MLAGAAGAFGNAASLKRRGGAHRGAVEIPRSQEAGQFNTLNFCIEWNPGGAEPAVWYRTTLGNTLGSRAAQSAPVLGRSGREYLSHHTLRSSWPGGHASAMGGVRYPTRRRASWQRLPRCGTSSEEPFLPFDTSGRGGLSRPRRFKCPGFVNLRRPASLVDQEVSGFCESRRQALWAICP